MGNVAGSGGYYVACSADAILADETTITASIGVVGGKVVTAGLWDWVGVNWVPVRRGANADLMNSARKFDDDQRKRIHDWMNEIWKECLRVLCKGGRICINIDATFVNNIPAGIAQRDNRSTKFVNLLGCINGYVSTTGNHNLLALPVGF